MPIMPIMRGIVKNEHRSSTTRNNNRRGKSSGAVRVLRRALEEAGCRVGDSDIASTADEVRHHTNVLCDWERACAPDDLLPVWIARGPSVASMALLPPDDLSRDMLASFGAGEDDAASYVIVQAPWGPPLLVDFALAARLSDIRPGNTQDHRYQDAVDLARRWVAEVKDAHDELTSVLKEIRAMLGARQQRRPSVWPFVADAATLWNDPDNSPLDFAEPEVLVTGSKRALRWFEPGWEGDRPLRYALVRSDDIGRWMAYEPGDATDATAADAVARFFL